MGTAHGVYTVHQPHIDLERLRAIRSTTPVPLVLHGGSGTPAGMIQSAIQLPGGGINKVNLATDLEQALLESLHLDERATDTGLRAFGEQALRRGAEIVQQVVE